MRNKTSDNSDKDNQEDDEDENGKHWNEKRTRAWLRILENASNKGRKRWRSAQEKKRKRFRSLIYFWRLRKMRNKMILMGVGMLALGWHLACSAATRFQHLQRAKSQVEIRKKERRNTRSTAQVDFLSKSLKLKQSRRRTNNPVAKLRNPCRCTVRCTVCSLQN